MCVYERVCGGAGVGDLCGLCVRVWVCGREGG